jgi:hypothetical protein
VDWADSKLNEAILFADSVFSQNDKAEREGVEEGKEGEETQRQPESDYSDDLPSDTLATGQLFTSFMTPSLASGSHYSSHTDGLDQEDSETSADEVVAAVPVPAKRPTRSQYRSKSKRPMRASSGSAGPRRNAG